MNFTFRANLSISFCWSSTLKNEEVILSNKDRTATLSNDNVHRVVISNKKLPPGTHYFEITLKYVNSVLIFCCCANNNSYPY